MAEVLKIDCNSCKHQTGDGTIDVLGDSPCRKCTPIGDPWAVHHYPMWESKDGHAEQTQTPQA